MHHVYIIECGDGSLYTGYTTDVERRFREHKEGKGGRYTRSREVLRVVHTETFEDRSSALKREVQIKALPRQEKLRLVESNGVWTRNSQHSRR